MPFRYPQFCPLARAAEVVGERWTLLIVRELLLSPRRFSDLSGPLSGVSSSVLAERLARLEERGLVRRRSLPPPGAASVYELTEAGRALRPAVRELGRWGLRFLSQPLPGDTLDPEWVRLGLEILARQGPVPARRFTVVVPRVDPPELRFQVVGGADGVSVTDASEEPDACLSGAPLAILGVASGRMDLDGAVRSGALRADGNVEALAEFPALFDPPETQPD